MDSKVVNAVAEKNDASILPAPVTVKSVEGSRLVNAIWVVVNGVSTIIVVFLNKIVFADAQFRECQIISAVWHFLITFVILYVATLRPFRLFEAIRLPIMQMLPICLMFSAFLVLNNLSLTYNTIGFFQLAKIMTTPCVVLINFVLFRKTVSNHRLLSVVLACTGVAMANGVTAQSNPLGAVIAVVAFFTTALYQIWIAKSLSDLGVSAPQLLLNQTPIASVILCFLVPLFDKTPVVSQMSNDVILAWIGSGLFAAMINVSQFLIIGRTSALTFNVVSIVKTVTILAVGWYLEAKVFTIVEIFGVVIALGGAFMADSLSKPVPASEFSCLLLSSASIVLAAGGPQSEREETRKKLRIRLWRTAFFVQPLRELDRENVYSPHENVRHPDKKGHIQIGFDQYKPLEGKQDIPSSNVMCEPGNEDMKDYMG